MTAQGANGRRPPARGGPRVARTPLVGRSEQLAGVLGALREARVVTLTGPGGAGKTRLAQAVLGAADELAPDGGFWVDLAGVHSAELVAETVLRTMDARRTSQPSPGAAVADRLGPADVVVALDNCEHLIAACAELVDDLLDCCPGLRVLATSREPLGVEGESVRPVPPLSLPPRPQAATLASVTDSAAGQLFVQRVRALLPDFALTEANAPAVARLCRRLDGLPLAIELAAARMRVLSLEQIADGLDLASPPLAATRSRPGRQQTLRATLDWSYDLLTEPERVVFRRLAVFPGTFDLAAAQRVAACGGIAPAAVLDLVARLVDRSLLAVVRSANGVRYRYLATVRDYARELLAASGEATDAGMAHLQHFCELAESSEPLLAGSTQTATLDRLETEGNNLRVALAFARTHAETRTGMRLAAALWRLCYLRGHYREGREWLDWAATVEPDGPIALRAKALRGSGSLAFLQCDYPAAVRRLEASLQLYREADDVIGAASVLQLLGSVAREQARYSRAEALHRESLELYAASGRPLGVAHAQGYLGFAEWLQGKWDAATAHCLQALAGFRALGDAEGIAWSLISLGTIAQYTGDYDRAAALLEEAHTVAVRAAYPEGVAWAVHERGLLALRRKDAAAESLLTESLRRHRELGDRWRTASVLDDLAAALVNGDPRRAAGLLGAAAALRDEIGTPIAPCEQPDHERTESAARAALGDGVFTSARTHGRAARLDDLLVARDTAAAAGAPADDDRLRIRLLGAPSVHRGDRLLTAADWGYGKPRELLYLLASTRRASKDQIGVALWPELSGQQLRNAFHTALRDLRRALGDPGWVVYSSDGCYSLDRARRPACDLHLFEHELAVARRAAPAEALSHLQQALGAYGGDFLTGAGDAEWVVERRAELRRAYAEALAGTGRLLESAGRYAEAVDVYGRAVRHDPLDEAAHRRLMTCLVRTGEPAQAARVYRTLAERLRAELGVEPAPETTAAYRKLLVSER